MDKSAQGQVGRIKIPVGVSCTRPTWDWGCSVVYKSGRGGGGLEHNTHLISVASCVLDLRPPGLAKSTVILQNLSRSANPTTATCEIHRRLAKSATMSPRRLRSGDGIQLRSGKKLLPRSSSSSSRSKIGGIELRSGKKLVGCWGNKSKRLASPPTDDVWHERRQGTTMGGWFHPKFSRPGMAEFLLCKGPFFADGNLFDDSSQDNDDGHSDWDSDSDSDSDGCASSLTVEEALH